MRNLLAITIIYLFISANLNGQDDFLSLDRKSYEYYLNGDYKNLQITSEKLLSSGTDYYYLRMRMGILSYNKQLYSTAFRHFNKAIEFNSLDTISREYIYFSYLFSGRKTEANILLNSMPMNTRTRIIKTTGNPGLAEFYIVSTAAFYDVTLYSYNNLYYESVKNSLNISGGFQGSLSDRIRLNIAFTNFRKAGTIYDSSVPTGKEFNFNQNQIYLKLTGMAFSNWELSGFGHAAFYNPVYDPGRLNTELLMGIGISNIGWKLRTGANFSLSNFGASNQIRSEGYLTYLPSGNLNLYFTTGGMYQADNNWGNTYQINQEIGFRILKSLWFETGLVKGNSFLYARNQGSMIDNSFQSPATIIYGNIIVLPWKKFAITISPFYIENANYSWDLNAYTRVARLDHSSFGGTLKLTYKNR